MHISYHDIKKALYLIMTMVGLFFIGLSVYLFNTCGAEMEPASYILTAMVTFVVGIICVLFGVDTYLLRDEPDIWR
jgi:uncharacterized membrane protein